MGDTPHEAGEWPQGRNPQRRKTGVLGWALLVLLMVALLTLWPG
ncbi:hypothetical protein [Streptomyces agglomeratus]|jgi:hypothetical protein|nr:hypothetical protein [Streptomyces agglomeratus]